MPWRRLRRGPGLTAVAEGGKQLGGGAILGRLEDSNHSANSSITSKDAGYPNRRMSKSRVVSTIHDVTNDVSVPASVPAGFCIAAGQHLPRATNSRSLRPADIATHVNKAPIDKPSTRRCSASTHRPSLITALHSIHCKFL
jgi:hypothetical protein